MLRQDNVFPLIQVGLVAGQGVGRPFTAEGKAMRNQIITLRRWVEEKVLELDPKKKKDQQEPKWPEEGEFKEVSLPNSYILVLTKMMEYYKPVGLLTSWSEMFAELECCLNGKSLADELDSLEDLSRESVKLVEKDEEKTEPKEKAKSA